MTIKTRIYLTTFAIANLGLIVYGVMALLKPEILLETFTTHIYQFPSGAAAAVTYQSALYRLLGYLNIIPGVLGLMFLRHYQLTGRKWFLKAVVASTAFTYLGPIVFDNTVGTIGFFEIIEHILFALIVIMGFGMLQHQNVEVS